METGFQCPKMTLLVGLITVLSHLEIAQIRISCSGWTHQSSLDAYAEEWLMGKYT
jgi:hypothetical protein